MILGVKDGAQPVSRVLMIGDGENKKQSIVSMNFFMHRVSNYKFKLKCHLQNSSKICYKPRTCIKIKCRKL